MFAKVVIFCAALVAAHASLVEPLGLGAPLLAAGPLGVRKGLIAAPAVATVSTQRAAINHVAPATPLGLAAPLGLASPIASAAPIALANGVISGNEILANGLVAGVPRVAGIGLLGAPLDLGVGNLGLAAPLGLGIGKAVL